MDIWRLISGNFLRAPHTRTPEALVPFPGGYRGELRHDSALCTACGTCSYVCSPSAIRLDRSQPEGVKWQYQMLQCTYCGFCTQYCPTHALSFKAQAQQPVFALEQTEHLIEYQACPRCGEAFIPLPQGMLDEMMGSSVPQEMQDLTRLCERCRKKVYSANIKRGFTGQ